MALVTESAATRRSLRRLRPLLFVPAAELLLEPASEDEDVPKNKAQYIMFENKYKFPFTNVSIKICESSYTVKSNNKNLCPVTKYFKYPAFSHHISSFKACNLNSTAARY